MINHIRFDEIGEQILTRFFIKNRSLFKFQKLNVLKTKNFHACNTRFDCYFDAEYFKWEKTWLKHDKYICFFFTVALQTQRTMVMYIYFELKNVFH